MASPSGSSKWNASGRIVVAFLMLVLLATFALVVVPFLVNPPPGVLGTPHRDHGMTRGPMTTGVVPMYRTMPPPAVVPRRPAAPPAPASSAIPGAP